MIKGVDSVVLFRRIIRPTSSSYIEIEMDVRAEKADTIAECWAELGGVS